VFFVDAAHFVLGAYLGFLWCFERLFVKSASGRQRFNVLGALNAISHELIIVTNETYIKSYNYFWCTAQETKKGVSFWTSKITRIEIHHDSR
jgi:hypothetical protein